MSSATKTLPHHVSLTVMPLSVWPISNGISLKSKHKLYCHVKGNNELLLEGQSLPECSSFLFGKRIVEYEGFQVLEILASTNLKLDVQKLFPTRLVE